MTGLLEDIVTGEESVCIYCGQEIIAVIDPYSGMVDWGSSVFTPRRAQDFGCGGSPETNEEECGSHDPGVGHTPCGFQIVLANRQVMV